MESTPRHNIVFKILILTTRFLVLPVEMSTNLILKSLVNSFSQFIVNFNMNKIQASLEKLLNMLTTLKGNLKKTRDHFVGGMITCNLYINLHDY